MCKNKEIKKKHIIISIGEFVRNMTDRSKIHNKNVEDIYKLFLWYFIKLNQELSSVYSKKNSLNYLEDSSILIMSIQWLLIDYEG